MEDKNCPLISVPILLHGAKPPFMYQHKNGPFNAIIIYRQLTFCVNRQWFSLVDDMFHNG